MVLTNIDNIEGTGKADDDCEEFLETKFKLLISMIVYKYLLFIIKTDIIKGKTSKYATIDTDLAFEIEDVNIYQHKVSRVNQMGS